MNASLAQMNVTEPASHPSSVHGRVTFSDPVFLMVNSLERGGTERQYIEMARALRATGTPVHLGCLMNTGPFASGVELAEFPLGGSLYGMQSIRSRLRLRNHLCQIGARIVHAFDFYTNLTLIPAARMAGIPIVGSHRQIGDLLSRAQFSVQLAAFRFCDRVVCNSWAAADRLTDAGLPSHKVVVIGNALPDTAFAEVNPVIPRSAGMLRVGIIARMNAEYKNHRGFLRMAKLLIGRVPNVQFVVVGDGPLRAELEREAAGLSLHGNVQFLGDRRDVNAVLRSLDVAVVPSVSESLSNVMLESMAAGVPVLATAVGGNVELGQNGRAILVPVNDDQTMAEQLARLLEDDGLRLRMSETAREFVKGNYAADRICRQYQELYAEVLREHQNWIRRPAKAEQADHSRIRVALVAPSLRYVGGQSVQADLLMKHWKSDADVNATFLAVDPRFPRGLRWAERIPMVRTVVRQPLYAWKLWRDLKDVDVVHIFSASYSSFLIAPLPAWLIAKARGKKALINYHSGEAGDHLRRSRIARAALKRADRLVVPSGFLKDVFGEFGLETSAVPNIVDLGQFHFRPRVPLRPHLICTRGFHPYYGVDVLVRAFAEVQKAYPEAQLDLVGEGPTERNIRILVRELNLQNVNFLGVISRGEIGRIYDRADIFVNASNLDNMPVSALEAFAAGTPVITTEPDGMKYLVVHQRTGLLSPPGDPIALARNILRILQEPELAQRLAQNAFEESRRYRWTEVRDEWLKIYSDLISPCTKAEGTLASAA